MIGRHENKDMNSLIWIQTFNPDRWNYLYRVSKTEFNSIAGTIAKTDGSSSLYDVMSDIPEYSMENHRFPMMFNYIVVVINFPFMEYMLISCLSINLVELT